jgi:hypothetical protein
MAYLGFYDAGVAQMDLVGSDWREIVAVIMAVEVRHPGHPTHRPAARRNLGPERRDP